MPLILANFLSFFFFQSAVCICRTPKTINTIFLMILMMSTQLHHFMKSHDLFVAISSYPINTRVFTFVYKWYKQNKDDRLWPILNTCFPELDSKVAQLSSDMIAHLNNVFCRQCFSSHSKSVRHLSLDGGYSPNPEYLAGALISCVWRHFDLCRRSTNFISANPLSFSFSSLVRWNHRNLS